MNVRILTVIPLSKSLPKDHLNYFSTKEISLGDIVEISIRKQTHKAIVTDIHEVKNQKAGLKDASFQLKAIKRVVGPSPFSPTFLQTLTVLKKYYVGTMSQIFSESISQIILDHLEQLKLPENTKQKSEFTKEKLLFQHPWEERIAFYKTLIRESFAKGESLRFIVPTIQDITLFKEALSKGIQDFCVTLHSKQKVKEIKENWNTLATNPHPLCIIQTSQFLCVPRFDVGTIILEKENSEHYQSNRRPYIDTRILVELYARIENLKLIMSDTLLRTETLVRHQNQEFGTVNNLFFRIESKAEHTIIDMRKEEHSKKILSSVVLDHITKAYDQGKKILFFALRPGLATTAVCKDCGTTQTYKNSPLTLHINPQTGNRFFKSKKYGEEIRSNIVCSECGSWNLESFGIGTETVEQVLKKIREDFRIFRIDQNQNNTPKQIQSTIQSFEETGMGSILVTSQIGLPYLTKHVDISCVVSLDTLFNIPQFNMYEKITHIIMDISTKTNEQCFVQTRYADQKITSIIQSKKLFDFFEYDTEERKFWEYPPFSVIVKMIYEGPKKEISTLERYIQKTFEEYEIYTYHTKSFEDSKTITNVVLKVPVDLWPLPWKKSSEPEKTQKLRQNLEHFPPSWSIKINPQNLI